MRESTRKPGVMLYFDSLRPAMKRLDDAQCGALLRRILAYAEEGRLPREEGDPLVSFAFDMLLPKIDQDEERFAAVAQQRRYAVFCREEKKAGREPLSFETWSESEASDDSDTASAENDTASDDNGRYPTTTTTTTPTTTPTTTTTPAGGTAARPPKRTRFVPPSLDEVKAYCRERGSPVDPLRFYEYFDAGGWRDSRGRAVKNWQQRLITWERGEEDGETRRERVPEGRSGAFGIHYDND